MMMKKEWNSCGTKGTNFSGRFVGDLWDDEKIVKLDGQQNGRREVDDDNGNGDAGCERM